MDALLLLFFGLIFVVFIIATWELSHQENPWAIATAVLGLICFISIIFQSTDVYVTGLPTHEIGVGNYKVAFVYRAGDNVNLGIEKPKPNYKEWEQINFYQFPIGAFDNQEVFQKELNGVPIKAKSLNVIKNGDFKKLHLTLK